MNAAFVAPRSASCRRCGTPIYRLLAEVLREDNRAIVRAASQASKAGTSSSASSPRSSRPTPILPANGGRHDPPDPGPARAPARQWPPQRPRPCARGEVLQSVGHRHLDRPPSSIRMAIRCSVSPILATPRLDPSATRRPGSRNHMSNPGRRDQSDAESPPLAGAGRAPAARRKAPDLFQPVSDRPSGNAA